MRDRNYDDDKVVNDTSSIKDLGNDEDVQFILSELQVVLANG